MQTGPRTTVGKATSSMNAMSHGLTSGKVVLPGEDASQFEFLRRSLLKEHRPNTPTEKILVEKMAQAHWRIDRVRTARSKAPRPAPALRHNLPAHLPQVTGSTQETPARAARAIQAAFRFAKSRAGRLLPDAGRRHCPAPADSREHCRRQRRLISRNGSQVEGATTIGETHTAFLRTNPFSPRD